MTKPLLSRARAIMLREVPEPSQDTLYATTLQTIGACREASTCPRRSGGLPPEALRGFAALNVILESRPQDVYSAESLRRKAGSIIKNSAAKTSAASFATGLPDNPAIMIAAGGADVAQYFGFAIDLAQQIAYCSARTSWSTAGAAVRGGVHSRHRVSRGYVRRGRCSSAGVS